MKKTFAQKLVSARMRALERQKRQDEKEERMLARWILFVKGQGTRKYLKQKDRDFIRAVEHKAHDRMMSDLILGLRTRIKRDCHHKLKGDPAHPISFLTFARRWYGAAKGTYRRFDVPALMKMRWEMRRGSTNTEMQERSGRHMQELQRQIAERERRELDLQVRNLSSHPGGEQGRDPGQVQLRERRPTPPATNRTPTKVGKKEEILLKLYD